MKFHDFMIDPNLGALGADTFRMWHVVARVLDGDEELLSAEDRALVEAVTGRTQFPTELVKRLYVLLGRRAGKSRFESCRAVYHAAQDYRDRLAPGETAVVALIATDRRQATVLYNYVRELILGSPLLAPLVTRETADTIALAHGSTVEVHSGSFRSVRGRSFASVIVDEAAFLRSETSALPDVELVRAVLPGLATLDGSLEVVSSAHMRRGILWDAHRKHYGQNASTSLVVQGSTVQFNPTISRELIDEAIADDPEAGRSEWLGEFRSDLSAALDPAWIESATDSGVFERPRIASTPNGEAVHYVAFTDPSGGSGKDSWATRIVHAEGEAVIDDAVLEIRPPFATNDAAQRTAAFLKLYGLSHVTGDRYAGRWPADALAACGISYNDSSLAKSDIYRESIALFSSGRVRLLDHARTLTQLRMLERRVRPGGRDQIDHPAGAHDDAANALCGALLLAARPQGNDCVEVYLAPSDVPMLDVVPSPFSMEQPRW